MQQCKKGVCTGFSILYCPPGIMFRFCALLLLVSQWILPINFRVTSLSLRQSYDSPSTNEVTTTYKGQCCKGSCKYNHNKTTVKSQRNHLHIPWALLYVMFVIMPTYWMETKTGVFCNQNPNDFAQLTESILYKMFRIPGESEKCLKYLTAQVCG